MLPISDLAVLNVEDAETLLGYMRGHWGIANKLHWPLDVTFREDERRNRIGHSAENFSRVRRMALNLLRPDQSYKLGLKAKHLKACPEEPCLLKLLGAEN